MKKILLLSALILSACQSPNAPPSTDSKVILPASFTAAPDNPTQTDIRTWWQQFNDPTLNRLITQALENAPDLAIARSQLEKAEATARLANADTGPLLGAGVSGTMAMSHLDNPLSSDTRKVLQQVGSDLGSNPLSQNGAGYQMGLSGTWAPDFFGKKQSDAQAAKYGALAEVEKTHGAQLLLIATLAQHYVNARALEAQKVVLETSDKALADLVRYAKGRFQAAQATQYDVDDISAKRSALQAKIATLDTQRANEIAQIAALIGTPDMTFPPDNGKIFTHLPQAPSGQYPADLITRRPDIRAYKAAILAQSAKRESAAADFYPRFTMNFGLLEGKIHLNGDLSGARLGGNGGLLGIGIELPIFTNGRLQAQLDRADADLKTAVLNYDKALLEALTEVNNSYRLAAALKKQGNKLATTEKQQQKQTTDARALFEYGRQTFDKIATAQLATNDTAEMRIKNQKGQALNLIRLYTALGGGW
ncbi:efflux transporter outer membrane subunit [Suttonella ornithocola]|uniref:Cation efflux system protein CusC n=1 Tax=Suttonella ornithocola TaxID=279832 RepID=A0A380MPH7_9GAMM|nr:TolC family protein [Suttonella ornithocola]SUO93956.1 Cation efflux system protein CusC precursor [Suttonella ornithocola]